MKILNPSIEFQRAQSGRGELLPETTLPPAACYLTLLEGFRLLLQFLVEAEADFFCGAALHMRSRKRLNYRLGNNKRKLRTPPGAFPLRIPHLLYLRLRVSIVNRAKRLVPEILGALARLHAGGVGDQVAGARDWVERGPASLNIRDEAASLIKSLWNIELPGGQLEKLVAGLVPVFDRRRAGVPPAASFPSYPINNNDKEGEPSGVAWMP